MIKFHFLACSCPALPAPFVEEAIFCSILYCCPLCQILIDYRNLGLFLGSLFCSIGPCVFLMPVTGCFDYSGLVLQSDIWYCDPSCFVLLSQNCCSYSGSFMVPYQFLKCLLYICEICHGYSNKVCIESINCFGYCGHFDNVNSSNP